jgi:oligopeptide/dipeptide ABC transporter ATP-binding protein
MPKGLDEPAQGRKAKLPVIPGETPSCTTRANSCRFESRCVDRMEQCKQREPAEIAVGEAHAVSCFKYGG